MTDSIVLPEPDTLLDLLVEASRRSDFGFGDYQVLQVVRYFAQTLDWDGLDSYVNQVKHLADLPTDREATSVSAAPELDDAIVAWVDAIGEAVQTSEDVKAVAISIDASEQAALGAFLCERDEDDSEDWPAFFTTDVPGPHLYQVLAPWLSAFATDPQSAGVGFRVFRTAAIASVGRAAAGWDWGVTLFWVEDDVTVAIT